MSRGRMDIAATDRSFFRLHLAFNEALFEANAVTLTAGSLEEGGPEDAGVVLFGFRLEALEQFVVLRHTRGKVDDFLLVAFVHTHDVFLF